MFLYFWMILQIIAENLPISSSGHVALLQNYVQHASMTQNNFEQLWAFDYVVQGVNAIIFLLYFFPFWWQLIVRKPITFGALFDKNLWLDTLPRVFLFGFVADFITVLFWYIDFPSKIDFPLSLGFFITGVILWSMRYTQEKKDIDIWSIGYAILLGLAQGTALFAGISRFALTVGILQWSGYTASTAFCISFLVAWPLLAAGSLLGLYKLDSHFLLSSFFCLPFFITMLTVALISYGVLWYVGTLVEKNKLWKFFYYMIIPIIFALWM
ncbi:MAG: undecaprenyl-diphosphate phosphatase [Candidatus Chromulinivorax sp.]